MQIAEEIVALRQKLGLAVPTLWAPAFGAANEVVWEIDYPDLATFQRENEAFYSDVEVMKHWRQLWHSRHRVQYTTSCCRKRRASHRGLWRRELLARRVRRRRPFAASDAAAVVA